MNNILLILLFGISLYTTLCYVNHLCVAIAVKGELHWVSTVAPIITWTIFFAMCIYR